MMRQEARPGQLVQAYWWSGKVRWLTWACFSIGLASLVYCLYDLRWPGHFVGDMYGLEVMVRLVPLAACGGFMLLGALAVKLGRSRQSIAASLVGGLLVVSSATALVFMALGVAASRQQDTVRRTYPLLSTTELLRIARERKDQFAIDELLVRKDPSSTPGLRDILLDESEQMNLRICAAHALGEIGGDETKAALETARQDARGVDLRTAIDYALQTRLRGQAAGGAVPTTQP